MSKKDSDFEILFPDDENPGLFLYLRRDFSGIYLQTVTSWGVENRCSGSPPVFFPKPGPGSLTPPTLYRFVNQLVQAAQTDGHRAANFLNRLDNRDSGMSEIEGGYSHAAAARAFIQANSTPADHGQLYMIQSLKGIAFGDMFVGTVCSGHVPSKSLRFRETSIGGGQYPFLYQALLALFEHVLSAQKSEEPVKDPQQMTFPFALPAFVTAQRDHQH